MKGNPAPVAHACNPSYSGGRNQEDHSSKPARANSSRDPILKNLSHKRAGGVAQGVGPKFKPQYHKKKREIPVSWRFVSFLLHFYVVQLHATIL
jgi:hypothetical protein